MTRILELDFGNTALKWRIVGDGAKSVVGRLAYSSLAEGSLQDNVQRVRVASVLTLEQTQTYLTALGIASAEIARSEADIPGFTNNYQYPEKLGVDRWLAAIAAHRDAGKRACLVIDCGTAITVDFISASGAFEGGYILAGKQLLQKALLTDTSQVRFSEEDAEPAWPQWPKNTAQAVQWGAAFILQAVVERAVIQARDWLGNNDFAIYLTGGDAKGISLQLENEVQYRPDLVLDGLAIALP